MHSVYRCLSDAGVDPYVLGAGIFALGLFFGWVVGRLAKRGPVDSQATLYDDIIKDILELQKIPRNEFESVLSVVRADVEQGRPFSDPRLNPVFRIECVYSKGNDRGYDLEVIVYALGEAKDKAKVTRIRQKLDWAYLPSDVRAKFIRERQDRIALLMYERKDCNYD